MVWINAPWFDRVLFRRHPGGNPLWRSFGSGRKRREDLAPATQVAFETYFRGRILPFDSEAAEAFAALAAGRHHVGRPISQADAQIAAIARSRGAALATCNVPDFAESKSPILGVRGHVTPCRCLKTLASPAGLRIVMGCPVKRFPTRLMLAVFTRPPCIIWPATQRPRPGCVAC